MQSTAAVVDRLRARVVGRFPALQEARTSDITDDRAFMRLYAECRPFTMTTISRMYALYQATRYVVLNRIPGDFVECGVWQGGSSMLMASTLLAMGETDRQLYLYDTFDGMTPPTARDVSIENRSADMLLARADASSPFLARAALDNVKRNMAATRYPEQRISFVQGPVEETLPGAAPERIALLRLDTDWYESTFHELVHLFPRLSTGGPLVLDDYGYWRGAREAVDRYFAEHNVAMLLNRVDWSGRVGLKFAPPG